MTLFESGGTAKRLGDTFLVSQKSEMGAFSVVTLRVATLKLPIPSFSRFIEKFSAVTFGSSANLFF